MLVTFGLLLAAFHQECLYFSGQAGPRAPFHPAEDWREAKKGFDGL
ncbi:hypothetical protein [Roseomonas sp. KE0001]|nr:hypothetical protein [Roseomonas sp. KE0001]